MITRNDDPPDDPLDEANLERDEKIEAKIYELIDPMVDALVEYLSKRLDEVYNLAYAAGRADEADLRSEELETGNSEGTHQ